MANAVKVGNLDIQFGKDFDQAKANQLVQTLQQVISAINALATSSGGSSGGTTPTTPTSQVLATQEGLGQYLTVSGLEAGQVLVAEGATTAHFGFLQFAQMAQTDPATFAAPSNGSVIAFVNGYWSAEANTLGLANPGSYAVILWDPTQNAGAGSLTWALAQSGITLESGGIAVNPAQIDHSLLENLALGNPHPQYALLVNVPSLTGPNVWTALQTFSVGLVSNSDIDLTGNLEQMGLEGVEDRIQNTDDLANEGTWRLHIEPGQAMFASVSDPDTGYPIGSDGENWLTATREAELVDTVNVQATYFTFNGFDVMVAAPITGSNYLPVIVAGVTYQLLTSAAVTGGGGGGGGSGTVTSVGLSTSSGFLTLSGTNPVTTSGTIGVDISSSALSALTTTESLASTALQPVTGLAGSYTNTNLTLNSKGQIIAAANGTGGGGTPASSSITLSGTSTALNASTAALYLINLTATTTVTFAGATSGQDAEMRLLIKQGGVAAASINWPSGTLWPGGAAPTLTTNLNHCDVIHLSCGDGSTWFGSLEAANVYAVVAGAYDSAVLADSPSVYWKLQDLTGTTAVDSGGSSINGTYSGAYSLAQAALASGLGDSVLFGTGGGSSGYIDVPNNTAFQFTTGSWSIEFWMKPTAVSGSRMEVISNGGLGYRFALSASTTGKMDIVINTSTYLTTATTFATNGVYHVVLVCDKTANTLTWYVNGSADSSVGSSPSVPSTGVDLYIGELAGTYFQYQGYLSNIAMYPSALSSGRIAAHYAAGT